jgi:ribosomal protein L44E
MNKIPYFSSVCPHCRKGKEAGHQRLMPVILAPQEVEIRRITVRSQPRQIVHKTPSQKNPSQKRAGGVAQGVGPEFKPQYHQKKREKKKLLGIIIKCNKCYSQGIHQGISK